MDTIIKAIPIYNFLNYCNDIDIQKNVLECGAGGSIPPLYIFNKHGYETYGIDISEDQIIKAENFCKENGLKLNIKKGDMRNIEFEDEFFSFVYSYNSIFHMSKSEIKLTINEIGRVLKKKGLCFINFLSIDDCRFGEGDKVGSGEYLQDENNKKIVHSYFDDNEAEEYLTNFKVLFKEKRVIERYEDGKKYKLSYIDYIIEKI